VFAEYNRVDYWGKGDGPPPRHQTRYGAEYWRARNVNDTGEFWWSEIWSGAWRQSSNEFAADYNTGILANAFRGGVRIPKARVLSSFTPYFALESSLTDNKTYYWENKLVTGGGMRFAPKVAGKWLNRFAVYGEYVNVAVYYRQSPPSSIPNHDVRAGITFSFGDWYR
jgi:hypothetical protein